MRDPETSGEAAPKVHPSHGGDLQAEVIVVGSELLRGEVGDSSAQIVAGLLTQRGAEVRRIAFIPDDVAIIAATIRASLERSPHFVVTIGGLGPADDDRTIVGVSAALNLPLTANPGAAEMVDRAYAELRSQRRVERGGINAVRGKMTRLPVGCTVLANEAGIAPGTLCRLPGSTAVISVPGTPREARAVFDAALPHLKDFGTGRIVARREVEAPMLDESALIPLVGILAEEYPHAAFSTRPVGSQKKGYRLLASIEVPGDTIQEAESRVGLIVSRLLALASGSK
jgi:molybdenum cofactor synthesis domain-containing protein